MFTDADAGKGSFSCCDVANNVAHYLVPILSVLAVYVYAVMQVLICACACGEVSGVDGPLFSTQLA